MMTMKSERCKIHPESQAFSASYAQFWDILEDTGLTPIGLKPVLPSIGSPVLLLGSGQGLISRYLLDNGLRVTSVDLSKPMASAAWQRRRVKTLIADAACLRLKKTFRTVIVATGVISPRHLEGRFVDDLLGSLAAHAREGTNIRIYHFLKGAWFKARKALGLDRCSNRAMVADARGDVDKAMHWLVRYGGVRSRALKSLFAKWTPQFERLVERSGRLAARYAELYPSHQCWAFFRGSDDHSWMFSEEQQRKLLGRIRAAGLEIIEAGEVSPDVGAVICQLHV
jgi:hypothetical protein